MDTNTEIAAGRARASVAKLVSAYVARNHLAASELPDLIECVSRSLRGCSLLTSVGPHLFERPTPTQISASISDEALISFEDGKPYKTLGRHLTARGLSAEAYRLKWGLPDNYPMFTRAYAVKRSALSRKKLPVMCNIASCANNYDDNVLLSPKI